MMHGQQNVKYFQEFPVSTGHGSPSSHFFKCWCVGGMWFESAVQWLDEEIALFLSAYAWLWCVVRAYVLYGTGYKQDSIFRAECSQFWCSISRCWLRMSLHLQFLCVISVSLDNWLVFFVYEFWFSSTLMAAGCFILRGISLLTSVIGADTLRRFYYALRPYLAG